MSTLLIVYAILCIGAVIGWIAHGLVVREQAEDEPTELAQFRHRWVNRR